MKPQDIIKEKSSLWIFGYGSLVWKPDFDYKRSKIGCIKGYKRRFWHGDDFYRGDKKRVRYVATLASKAYIYYYIVLLSSASNSSLWLYDDFSC